MERGSVVNFGRRQGVDSVPVPDTNRSLPASIATSFHRAPARSLVISCIVV
jgi:hypothetical protein